MKHFFKLILISCVCIWQVSAQSIGDWRMHINYQNATLGALGNNNMMVATQKSVYLYDFDETSLLILDKAKGLSDYGVNAIHYEAESEAYLIAYNSSNLDLLRGTTLVNLPDIKNKLITGSKNVNAIFSNEGFAYVCTDFGIVVIDIENEEVDNTYIVGSTGNQTPVFDGAILNDTIYVLTQEGLKSAYLGNENLLDYSSWTHNFSPLSQAKELEAFNDSLFAIGNGLFKLENGTWVNLTPVSLGTYKNLHASKTLTWVVNNLLMFEFNDGEVDTLETPFLIDPSFAIKKNDTYFYGDYKLGFFRNQSNVMNFSSPFTNDGFQALSFKNITAITSGGFNKNVDALGNVEGGFYLFENNSWSNQNIYSSIGTSKPSQDLNRLSFNPFNNKLYIGMMKGLIEYDFSTVTIYNETNSPIDSAIGNGFFKIITGVDVDSKGNVWMLNPQTSAALLVKTLDNNWFEFILGNDNTKLNNLFIDSYDQKWIALRNEGVTVYKEGENLSAQGSQKINLSSNGNQGNLPNNNVNCIAEDLDGQIWLGTDEGIAVFSCPGSILEAGSTCKISERITNTLDEYTEYLFETDAVACIEVDGANRKWIGTSAGVWLLSEDGKEEIHRFNTENSPLPSNNINSISVNKATGEVFILTDQGIVSYFSDATEGAENYDEVKAFPNPVRPDYTGYISITGLVQDAFVKITDTHGVLIDEGFALGGKYVWNGNDYNGKRANSGVYYVFSSNPDGSQKVATKIAFVK